MADARDVAGVRAQWPRAATSALRRPCSASAAAPAPHPSGLQGARCDAAQPLAAPPIPAIKTRGQKWPGSIQLRLMCVVSSSPRWQFSVRFDVCNGRVGDSFDLICDECNACRGALAGCATPRAIRKRATDRERARAVHRRAAHWRARACMSAAARTRPCRCRAYAGLRAARDARGQAGRRACYQRQRCRCTPGRGGAFSGPALGGRVALFGRVCE